MSDVEYRTLAEYDGYRFGSDGSIWSCWKKKGRGLHCGSRSYKSETWRLLSPPLDDFGYPACHLRRTDGSRRRVRRVHHLILAAFGIVKPFDRAEVCHWNDIKTDNRLENLRWDTQKANRDDSRRNGTIPRTKKRKVCSAEDIVRLRASLSIRETCKQLGVSRATVLRAQKRVR